MSAKRQAGILDDMKNQQDPPPTKKPRETIKTVRSDGNQITNTEGAPPERRQIAATTGASNETQIANTEDAPPEKRQIAAATEKSNETQIANTKDAPPERRQIAATTETSNETQIANTKDAPPEKRQIAAATEKSNETQIANTKDAPPERRQIAATTETSNETQIANTKDVPPERRQIVAATEKSNETQIANTTDAPPERRQIAAATETSNETQIANTKDAPPKRRQLAATTETSNETQIANTKDAPPERRQIAATTETSNETQIANTKDAPPEKRQIAAATEKSNETQIANSKDAPPERRQIAATTETSNETQIANTKDAPPERRQIAATTETSYETQIANTKDAPPEKRQIAAATEKSNETQIANTKDPSREKSKIATTTKTGKENQIVNTTGLQGYTCRNGIIKSCAALFESSIDSESDDEFINNALRAREKIKENTISLINEISILAEKDLHNYVKNYLDVVLPTYTELEFRRHFRISRSLYKQLYESFAKSNLYKSVRADKRFSAKLYMAVFLWFAGHEACSFRDLVDRFDISLGTICDIMQRVTSYISSLSPKIIKWPNTERKLEISRYFGDKYGFPKAIGCMDLTRIIIDPFERSSDDYYDEEGDTSICFQGICDENKKFIYFSIGIPGASEAVEVFENSSVCKNITSFCEDYYLLADSAYPCSSHCITTYPENGCLTDAQKSFNDRHNKGRVKIKHTFGILKQRFRQLYYCKIPGALNQNHFIHACCVLHNMANESDLCFRMESVSQDTQEYIDDYYDAGENAIRNAILSDMEVNS